MASPGNSNSERVYNFTDNEAGKSGVRYYRLKVVDRDNTFVYSPVRPVVFNDEIKWQVYPNPSNGNYSLMYQLDQNEILNVKVYDVNGKLVKQVNLTGNGFVQNAQVDLRASRFSAGVYLLLAEAGERKYSTRLIKK